MDLRRVSADPKWIKREQIGSVGATLEMITLMRRPDSKCVHRVAMVQGEILGHIVESEKLVLLAAESRSMASQQLVLE